MPSVPVTIVGVMTYSGLDAPGGPGGPPIIWPSPGYPAHPIAPGGPPPGIWPSPGYPAHPIAPGGPPPGIWPGPGQPPNIWPGPGPLPPLPGGGEPAPPGIWGGANEPFPTPPIEITIGDGTTPGGQKKFNLKAVYHPTLGWIGVWVPAPTTPSPAPA